MAWLQETVPTRALGLLEFQMWPFILKGDKIVIPEQLRTQVLQAIHTGHQGETKCILLARDSVFWPGISTDIRRMVKNCGIYGKHQPAQAKLPIMQPDLPTRQWEKLGTDIFELKGLKWDSWMTWQRKPYATTSPVSWQNLGYAYASPYGGKPLKTRKATEDQQHTSRHARNNLPEDKGTFEARSIHSVPPNVTTDTLQVPTPLPPAAFTSSVEPLAPSAGEPVMTEPVTTVEAAAPMKTKAPMKAGPAS